ncbi:hypothetical protein RI129_011701 [Pyrocoelia pectoralis]|uniref:C2H2-type domain-containing protein n=1 Tax=Pyrocoelia pectoralis TaxID=417401 RepID=A0AAN7V8E1_9COLE
MLSCSPMLLMPNSSRSSSPGPRRGPPTSYGTSTYAPLNFMGTSQHLRPSLSWASVASWFFRPPDTLPLTTVANNDQLTSTCTTSRPVVLSSGPGSSPANSSETSPPRPSSAATSALIREERIERERIFQPPTICTAIKCTVPNCSCDSFVPGKRHLRYCETCKHGWVPHALDKLGTRHLFTNSVPEPVQPNVAFDIASLVLYGCQALPIRLKILLDRLFSVLQKDQVLQVLHGFGWTPDDYARGYILQEAHGSTLDRWSICSPEEEPLVLQQFLRFGETRAITQQLLLAQQALHQESTLERLGHRPPSNPRRAMSPNRRPSPPTFSPSAFHPSWLPTMSPHQKQSLNFLKMPSITDAVSSTSKNIYGNNSITSSPLNRLQNMQPFDFRKLGAGLAGFSCQPTPDLSMRRKVSESDTPGSLNLSINTSLAMCPPPPLPTSSLPASLNHSAAAMAAAVSANSLAAASLVASSFSSLMSTGLTVRSKSPTMVESITASGTSEVGSEDDDNDNSHSALNLSRDKDTTKALRQSRIVSGRKPITPTKRQWGSPGLPLNLGTQFINPATGKKRVQCNVCLKTFCDKGALKIHFSAVHLREMHKCTVEGCNMMFSSRRSRNRHSANPNPKLHSPHLRRKISPNDGRSAQPHPMLLPSAPGLPLPPTALNSLNPFGPFPILTPPPDIRHHSVLSNLDFKHSLDLSVHRAGSEEKGEDKKNVYDNNILALTSTSSSNHEDDDDYEDDGIVVVGGDEDEDGERIDCSNGVSDLPEDFSMSSKRFKMSVSDVDDDMGSNADSNEDSVSIIDTHSLKDELNLSTNKRKRKSQNPTKCSVPVITDDGVSDGESSIDAYSDRNMDKQKLGKEIKTSPEHTKDSKGQRVEDMPINLGKSTADVNANESEAGIYNEIKTSLAPLFPTDKLKKERPFHEAENAEDNDRPASTVESNRSDESFDSSNALRHLESLSHGNFGDLMTQGLHLGLGVQNPHLAPLGFMMGGGPPSPARSQASSGDSSNGTDSPDESSQNQLFGLFDNGQFISTMDVPIDKDNPRRCAACGKIFQNHFGVKTHYQNVHLKLMHKCNVDGCNAAFPSKRSRDRHSANLNLHRKLLSTTDKGSGMLERSHFPSLANSPTLQGDFFARLYAEEALKNHHVPTSPVNFNQLVLNGDRIPPPPFLLPPLGGLPFPLGSFNHFSHMNGSSALTRRDRSSASNSPTPASPPPTSSSPDPLPLIHSVDEDLPTPDKDGNLPCRFCKTSFNSSVQLKEHCESNHLLDMFKCKVVGCPKVFMSRTKRNLHSDNYSLHLNLFNKKEPKGNMS